MPKPCFNWGRRPCSLTAIPPVDAATLVDRPGTRGVCRGGTRPCPFIGCRHHLYLNPERWHNKQTMLCNFPDWEPWDLPETCALDVAERGGIDIVEIGILMNLSKSGVEKILHRALARVKQEVDPEFLLVNA